MLKWLSIFLVACSISIRAAASFGLQVGMWTNNVTTAAWTVTFTNAIPAGKTAVALIGWEDTVPPTLSSMTDSKGNQWTIVHQKNNNTVHNIASAYSVITNAITTSDTFTLTWSSAVTTERGASIIYLDNVAQTGGLEASLITNRFNSNIVDTVSSSAGSISVIHIQAQQIASGGGSTQILYTNTGSAYTFLTTNMDFGRTASTVGLRHYMGWKANASAGSYALGGFYTENSASHDESFLISILSFKQAANYYVDFVGGSDGNAGTSTGAPFKHCPGDTNATSVAASTTLAPGVTVYFKGGVVYSGDIATKVSGSAGFPITYDGTGATWGSGVAKIDLLNTYYHAIGNMTGTHDYITVKGFDIYNKKNNNAASNQTITRGGVDITGVNYGGNNDVDCEGVIHDKASSFWYIDGVRIHDTQNCYDTSVQGAETDSDPQTDAEIPSTTAGIVFYNGAHSCTVTNSVLWAIGRTAIKFFGATNGLVIDCNIGGDSSVTATNRGWFAVGVKMSNVGSVPAANIIVRTTVVHDGWQYQGDDPLQRCHAGDWFHLYGDNDGVLEVNQDCHDILFDRVYCYSDHVFQNVNGTSYWFIEDEVFNVEWRNVVAVNDFADIIEMRDCSNMVINASTLISVKTQPLTLKAGSANGFGPKAVRLRGTVLATQSGNSANVAMGTSSGYNGQLIDSDYCLYYTSAHNNRINWQGTNYTSIATWRTITGNDTHSIFANPTLVLLPTSSGWATASNGDYEPDTGSPLIDAGATIAGFSTDYNGVTRPRGAAWDIGAFETTATAGGGGPSYTLRPGLSLRRRGR